MTREQLLETAKPILFNTEMVRAILDGRKTVTRRIAKGVNAFSEYGSFATVIRGEWTGPISEENVIQLKSRYKTGDILYVRETWGHGYEGEYIYKADDKLADLPLFRNSTKMIYRPSIFMPKAAARIFLKVTNVRVEQLQEMTDVEAEKEGAQPQNPFDYTVDKWPNKEHFKEIWNSTLKKSDLDRYGWEANPYVWVIEFERVYPD